MNDICEAVLGEFSTQDMAVQEGLTSPLLGGPRVASNENGASLKTIFNSRYHIGGGVVSAKRR